MVTYNDAVHGHQIVLSPVQEAFFQHPALLQLRYKKQLGLTERVFTNATHTRYLHSVGASICAGRVAAALNLSEQDASLLQAAAALHDIGHYPFSHAVEETRKTHHEEVPQRVLRGKDFGAIEAQPLLETLDALGVDSAEVASVLAGTHRLSPLVSGAVVDVDRLDYLPRDFRACGVSFGADIDRIVHTLRFVDGTLGVAPKGVVSLTSFLVARSLAYDQIYLHHTAQVAETMLQFAIRHDPLLTRQARSVDEEVHRLSDAELLSHLCTSEDETSRSIARRLCGPRGGWYKPLLSIGGEEQLARVRVLFDSRGDLEPLLAEHGLLWSWNNTKKALVRRTPSPFPVTDGSDLFSRPLARAAFRYVPERLFTVYGSTGSAQEREHAQEVVDAVAASSRGEVAHS